MKKNLFVMAMAGMALASCVSDEVAEVTQKNEQVKISFDGPVLYNNAESRAKVYKEYSYFTYNGENEKFPGNYSYPREEKFIVFSNLYTGDFTNWSDDANYWGDKPYIEVSYVDAINGWTSKQPYYWPSEGKLAFAACSPSELSPMKSEDEVEDGSTAASVTYGSTGFTIDNFKVSDNPDYQYELLYSSRSFNNVGNQSGSAGFYNGAKIKFKHALSSIHFAVKKERGLQTDIILRKITLKNVRTTGKFNENVNETTKISNPEWTINSDVETHDYVVYDIKEVETTEAVHFPDLTPEHIHELSKSITNDYSTSLLLLPQDLTVEDTPIIAEVIYQIGEIEDENGNNIKTVTVELGGRKGQDIANENAEIEVNKWLPGKKYTYVLNYSAYSQAKDQIYFAPEVSPWERIDLIYIDLHELD